MSRSSVELFTGCGGLAMGLSRVGFRALRMVEWDRHSVTNVLHNRARGLAHVRDWPIRCEDVRDVDWRPYAGLDLVAGGPPCQPFSIGGKHRGHEDRRDMWPEAVRAVREIEPKGFLFENVRGLARGAFADYLAWVVAALSYPHVARGAAESRAAHHARIGQAGAGRYRVNVTLVNAADYGAAQKRHRVILMGVHCDLGVEPAAPNPTHSRERLIWDQWVSGDYWTRHGMRAPPGGPDRADAALARRLRAAAAPETLPWRTVRDAIRGLGAPDGGGVANHCLNPGARSYPGHTGSPPDMPAKALKAGVHGVPGGENTLALPGGGVRYLTVREGARLQGLPDDYEFVGSWSENMRQLGNAVPAELAAAAGAAIRDATGGGVISGEKTGRLMGGYGEFEIDIPKVMRGQLPEFFATLRPEALTAETLAALPEGAQGAYLLFLDAALVYVGKTDAQAGFRARLSRHAQNVRHRRGLDPARITFKAARIFVFSTFDLETMLIEEYGRQSGSRPVWNFSGFGSNDPGRNREDQKPAQFDRDHPVDIDRETGGLAPGVHGVLEAVMALKANLPYLFRFEADGSGGAAWRGGHRDMMFRTILVPGTPVTTRALLRLILEALPPGWQATVLPNRVILYRETRSYRAQVEALRRDG